jgi:hypothetical protein
MSTNILELTQKIGRGRPKKSIEEKRNMKRIYEGKYQNNRYMNDEKYREKKKQNTKRILSMNKKGTIVVNDIDII